MQYFPVCGYEPVLGTYYLIRGIFQLSLNHIKMLRQTLRQIQLGDKHEPYQKQTQTNQLNPINNDHIPVLSL